ncbi:MAG: bifunctional aldolase/short-chain dehydrogenase, partial [Gammaproteobacteria bacterium]|nr:bifunctional aldolase/short-chain dehydrogenase [Gammaproteobacteria bacterium]
MKNRWNKQEARACANQLELRAYSSRLLGRDSSLVLHGGGNTSVKGELTDIFGETRRVLFVKGSGWDLKCIGAAGFAPTDLDYLLRLAELEQLSDSEMMRQLRLATLDPAAPNPSVEAILHALIPHRYVDHTHADAVVTLSNSPDGERILRELYGDEVLVLPYIMPGFILARQVAAATRDADWDALSGIVLLQHGIFSFHEDAEGSYEAMIELVDRA